MICSVGSFLGTTQTSRWPRGDAALIGVRGVATSPGCCQRRTGRRARPTGRPGRPRRSRRELGGASAPTLPGHLDARSAAMSPGSGRLFRVTSGCGAKEETECLRRRSSHSARQFTHGRVAWVAVGRGDPRRFLLTTTATGIPEEPTGGRPSTVAFLANIPGCSARPEVESVWGRMDGFLRSLVHEPGDPGVETSPELVSIPA